MPSYCYISIEWKRDPFPIASTDEAKVNSTFNIISNAFKVEKLFAFIGKYGLNILYFHPYFPFMYQWPYLLWNEDTFLV